MDITQDKILEIIRRAIERTPLTRNARILIHPSGVDFVAKSEEEKISHEIRPVWNVELLYPMGARITPGRYKFEIETLQFESEAEIEAFLISLFQSEIGEESGL